MKKPENSNAEGDELYASSRKRDHIDLAFKARIASALTDQRFDYEPLLAAHPVDTSDIATTFDNKSMSAPLWISSMTGGTEKAGVINLNLAKACGEFKLGMGLGSCRQLLYSDDYLQDFQIRKYLGDQPFYANLGVAQIESILESGHIDKISQLIDKLDADGLIIHVNPMQEWLQPEGDHFKRAPIHTISDVLEKSDIKVIVKEVGQGMGPRSIEALLQMPLAALDFAASGGTNFALMEILRSSPEIGKYYQSLVHIGHTSLEMVSLTNQIARDLGDKCLTKQVIISGGITDFLDGYYLIEQSHLPAIYGQASGFLKHAMGDYSLLQDYISKQINGLSLAKAYLKIKSK